MKKTILLSIISVILISALSSAYSYYDYSYKHSYNPPTHNIKTVDLEESTKIIKTSSGYKKIKTTEKTVKEFPSYYNFNYAPYRPYSADWRFKPSYYYQYYPSPGAYVYSDSYEYAYTTDYYNYPRYYSIFSY